MSTSFQDEQNRFDRNLLNSYMDMYNSTLRELDRLYDQLDSIREHIHDLDINHRNRHFISPTRRERERPIRNNIRGERNNSFTSLLSSPMLTNVIRNFYDQVPVRPSTHVLQNAIVNTTYGNIINLINSECPISLERFNETTNVSQIRHCGHIFTPGDLSIWFESNVRCPVCRHDIRENVSFTRNGTLDPSGSVIEPSTDTSVETSVETSERATPSNPYLNFANDVISNIRYNDNGEIIFDISSNYVNDLIRTSTRNLLDISGNSLLLFETILRR